MSCLLLRLKLRCARGASHLPTFMGNFRTISHTMNNSLIYPVGEGNEIVWGKSKHLEFGRLKYVTLLQGSNMSIVTPHEFDIRYVVLWGGREFCMGNDFICVNHDTIKPRQHCNYGGIYLILRYSAR